MWWKDYGLRLRALLFRRRMDEELQEEPQFHIEMQARKNQRHKSDTAEAKRQARLQFGSIVRATEECREQRGLSSIEILAKDLRFALRMLRKSPGFATVALLTLALGISANTASFSVVYGVLLEPMPYPSADRIGKVWLHFSPQNLPHGPLSVADYLDWRARNHAFENLSAFTNSFFDLRGVGTPRQVAGASVTSGFFSIMQVPPILGRTFQPGEDSGTSASLVVIGESLWRRVFGADKSVIGRAIELNGSQATVIGVMPDSFRFPNENTELWANLHISTPAIRGPFFLTGLGRLRPGVTWKQAQADANSIGHSIEGLTHGGYRDVSMPVLPIRESLVGNIRLPLLVVFGAVLAVLLIATVNVANLMLARSTARQSEIAVRVALGAQSGRLFRQLVTESLTLAVAGGAFGTALAYLAIDALRAWPPDYLPRVADVRLNTPVLIFTALVVIAAGLIFGSAPAREAMRTDPARSLGEGARASSGSPGRRLRASLAVAEIALSFVLLIIGGLLLHSFERLENGSTGIHTPAQNILTMLVSPSGSRYKDANSQTRLYGRILDRVRQLPGVESAAFSDCRPPNFWANSDTFHILGQPWSQEAFPSTQLQAVGPEYFRVLGIPLLGGRLFDEQDVQGAAQVAVVSSSFANRFFRNQDPIEHWVSPSAPGLNQPPYRIVGVVADVKYSGIQSDSEPVWYSALAQGPSVPMFLLVRSPRSAEALKPAVEGAVRSVDSDLVLSSDLTLDAVIGNSVAQPRFQTALLVVFSLLALILAMVGTYGVVSYSVARRTREIAVRVALGAQPSAIFSMVLKEGAELGVAGIALGMLG